MPDRTPRNRTPNKAADPVRRTAYQVIRQVGNYGEMYERSVAPLGLPRGPNALAGKGGLQFAPPIR